MSIEETNIPVIQEGAEQDVQTQQEAINITKLDGAVNSVNGMEGDVVLTAADVGALPDDTFIPTATSELYNDSDFVSVGDLARVATTGSYVDLTNKPNLATVATSGSYEDLSNKPTIPTVNNATLTIQKNGVDIQTFNANSATDKIANITVPTKTSELSNDSNFATTSQVNTAVGNEKTARQNADNALSGSIDTINGAINKSVVTDIIVDDNPSTTTIQLDATKTNIKTSTTATSNLPLPVASSTQAGVMNTATFNAVTQNTSDIEALTNGAVAITGLASNPTQAALTSAWKTATGLTNLMNRAGIYDVTNTKYWTYYTNDTTWHYTTGSATVKVNTFTNDSDGMIKGSTATGQVFAENDGTGSVNGWDTLSSAVADNTSKLSTIAQGAEVNVQADWAEADSNADDYIKNKPSLATVATSGSYNDLSNTPTIPTTVAQLTDAGDYYTAAQTDAAIAAAIANITDYDGESF